MNTAHQHTANADDYLSKGLIVLAAEEHFKAAEAYLAAIDRSHDESARRTLRRLHDEHCKAGKELQRKIEKLKNEGKDPALPQKAESSRAPPLRQHASSYLAGSPRIHSSSPPPHRPMTDSQNAVDESFMLLGGQRSDPGDAFNQFWNIMQGMLDNLSQPVAFATVPLGNQDPSASASTSAMKEGLRKDNSFSSDTDYEEPMLSRFTRRMGIGPVRDSGKQKATPIDTEGFEDEDLFDEEGDHLSESFCLIPSGDEPSPAALKKENTSLRAETAALQKRLKATERMLQMRKEQDVQLRDSIFQATREAQRAMGTSGLLQRPALDLSALNSIPAVPIPGMNTGREAQYARRVKELEDELRAIRAENEKHKLMITKFRERWEKLKESAKRKKEAKVAAEVAMTGARDRIVEEPEAEEELDGATES
ncbi:hypothetical protein K443DRAFT_676492 [Laccaria amethystina LaAM-08-1]|uniref:MIT domain-containing protein n=1 Tax=Laccaria amethystina LaAM-08-1 TaxID=1095629 RepID=A0A0C9Y1C8_9AGAR|nr:hypothetical protein K443DRAFT_676492 [Laccaria amethystina LaAM-08-1]